MRDSDLAVDKKPRHVGIEVLRVLAMLMICVLHVNMQSGALVYNIHETAYLFSTCTESVCLMAVDLYAMITGYVMIENAWKLKRLIFLLLTVLFWLIVLHTIFYYTGFGLPLKNILNNIFLLGGYWYVCAYICLFFLIPYINSFLNSLNKRHYKLLLTLLILYTISGRFVAGYNVNILIICYIVGGYFKKYPISLAPAKLLITASLFSIAAAALAIRAGSNISSLSYSGICVFIPSILVFCAAVSFSHYPNWLGSVCCHLGPYTFGVYLIQCHICTWKCLYDISHTWLRDTDHPILLLSVLPVLLFILCVSMDVLRAKIFKYTRISHVAERISLAIENEFIKITFFNRG